MSHTIKGFTMPVDPDATLAAAAALFGPFDRDLGVPGVLAPMPCGFSTFAPSASRAYLARFVPSRNMNITGIAFGVHLAATANDNVDVGLYDNTGTRIISTGSTAGKLNALGTKFLTFASTPLTKGVAYFAALATGTIGGTGCQLGLGNVASVSVSSLFAGVADTPDNRCIAMFKNSSFPLPSSLPFTSVALSTGVPLLAVRES